MDLIEWQLELPGLVRRGEPVVVVDCKHQGLVECVSKQWHSRVKYNVGIELKRVVESRRGRVKYSTHSPQTTGSWHDPANMLQS